MFYWNVYIVYQLCAWYPGKSEEDVEFSRSEST